MVNHYWRERKKQSINANIIKLNIGPQIIPNNDKYFKQKNLLEGLTIFCLIGVGYCSVRAIIFSLKIILPEWSNLSSFEIYSMNDILPKSGIWLSSKSKQLPEMVHIFTSLGRKKSLESGYFFG